MARKMTCITQFIQEVADLIDRGEKYSIEEINSHIENKDIIDWLEKKYPFKSDNKLDLSLFGKEDRNFIHEKFYDHWAGYVGTEYRKWGIKNNGLCLLVSWGTEIVRSIYEEFPYNSPEADVYLK